MIRGPWPRGGPPATSSCMQNVLELATLAVFVVAYYLRGIYTATAALMAAVAVVVLIDIARTRRVPLRHGLSAALVFLFGAATLLLHNRRYIEWKPTVFFWLAAVAFLGSFWIGKRPLVATLLGAAIDPSGTIPERLWRRLNALWVVFYLGLGVLNIQVAYHASERTWVNFKVFGLTLATAGFVFAQVLWLARRAAPAAIGPTGPEQTAPE
jgi:intracellular septation protein